MNKYLYGKDWLIPALSALAMVCDAGWAQSVPAPPQAGIWELSVTLEGAPMGGGGTRVSKACIPANQLAAAPEQAFIDAAAPPPGTSGQAGPKGCNLREIRRDGSQSSWLATCEGPRGAIQGKGSGALEGERAMLEQLFELRTPLGALKLQQTVRANRVGDC